MTDSLNDTASTSSQLFDWLQKAKLSRLSSNCIVMVWESIWRIYLEQLNKVFQHYDMLSLNALQMSPPVELES